MFMEIVSCTGTGGQFLKALVIKRVRFVNNWLNKRSVCAAAFWEMNPELIPMLIT